MTREQKDALIDGHFRAEEQADLRAIVSGFEATAEHDVAGRAGGPIHGGERIAAFYRALLEDLRIDRFETIYRRYGEDHAVDESILHATAIGRPFGLDGRGRQIQIRVLHLFEFGQDLISRESAWLDMAALQQQLAR
jgi:hypothetical protein